MKVKVSFKKPGGGASAKFKRIIEQAKDSYVLVGVTESAGKYQEQGGPSVAEVATWNEFGTETIPERSFIRGSTHSSRPLIKAWQKEALDNLLSKEGYGLRRALASIGMKLRMLIIRRIKSNIPPPNAPSTLAEKKRLNQGNKTLIASRLLIRSIAYQVSIASNKDTPKGD